MGRVKKEFYRLGNRGVDLQFTNFWETDKLPRELAERVNDFKRNWGKIFQKYFMNDDLCYIIEYALDGLKVEAWKQLLIQHPRKHDLHYIIVFAPDEWK